MLRLVKKPDGYGPYLWLVQWTDAASGRAVSSVFTHWEDLECYRKALHANGIPTSVDLAVDHLRQAAPEAI